MKKLKEKILSLKTQLSNLSRDKMEEKNKFLEEDVRLCREILSKYGDVDLVVECNRYGYSHLNTHVEHVFIITLTI